MISLTNRLSRLYWLIRSRPVARRRLAFLLIVQAKFIPFCANITVKMKCFHKFLGSLIILKLAFAVTANAQDKNNAVIPGDFADPSIIKTSKGYFAVATSSEWAPHLPVYRSTDLKTWVQEGYIFDKTPVWASGSFWAPEYYYMHGTYYVYYTARRKSDGHSYIGVATSKYPDKGFKDHGVLLAFGTEAIDPFIYNDNGQLYITFKAYGLNNRPIEILGQKISAGGLKVEGEPFSLLKDSERMGMEGQSILKKGEYYYLFYSAGNCCGTGCSYNVRVARALNFKGPYQEYSNNPLLQGNAEWECTGHGTFVSGPTNKTYYLHHAYNKSSKVFTGRQGLLAALSWQSGWPALADQPVSNTGSNNITANFMVSTIAKYWQWDFRNATPVIKQGGGKLRLSGSINEENLAGVALTVRPTTNNFEVTTTVSNQNKALKGLTFYGDANAAMGIGIRGNEVEVWTVKGKSRTVLISKSVKMQPIDLKLMVGPDKTCKAYYRQGNTQWMELTKQKDPINISFLPQWDRSPRPGLLFKGEPGSDAEFSTFALKNL